MTATITCPDVIALPLAPKNPMPYFRRLAATRRFDTGLELMRDSGGPVTRNVLGPSWMIPSLVCVASPRGAHDVLARTDAYAERAAAPIALEIRRLVGDNLLVVPHHEWLPRRRALQPIFTKHRIPRFAGHMAEAAEQLAGRWALGAAVDLDAECRALTLQALGRSILGIDLGDQTQLVGAALRTGGKWAADRALRPVNLPRWFPTRGQRSASTAVASLHALAAEILRACRADPTRDAPLVRALMQTTDPETGQPLSDRAICDELVLFLLAGHDTTSTALTYALWALGHRPELQQRVAAEVAARGDRRLTQEDVPGLRYTVQVLHEALRLCPPAPAVGRMVMADIEVDGYRLSAGTFAIVAIYAIHRDPTLWEDPLHFDPDRFSLERSKGRDRWQYLPFGGGPRACIGDHFAMLEATLALATILRQIKIHSLSGDFPTITPLTTIAAAPIRAVVGHRVDQ
ncbi:cytochrome P450 [Mycobacterium colombiense]|uniref:Cytochrome P450 n=1 Tax=Mycobacterium colombiense TaxID=339268 RepID=A0A1A2YDF5_9MYCO|nr:cytochrome P450 [Mycobacterium colombiense]OBI35076.1 cytochrome P450 [Mycobacterium colombiense]